MALNLQEKKTIISKINEISKLALSVVTANSNKVSTNDITKIRKKARENKVYITIVKNTLLKLAIKKTPFECLKGNLTGPTLIAYSMEHPGSAARLFKEFEKENSNFKITGSVFENKLLSNLEINQLATIPTYNEAIGKLLFIIKEAAIGKLLRTIVAISKLKKLSK